MLGGLFGGSKKDKNQIPEVSDVPLKAYVRRTKPERVGRRQVAGKLKGDFDDWTMLEELEDMITEQFGGGTFQCKVFDSKDKSKYVGCHTFTAPGEPLLDGEPIPDDEPRVGGGSLGKIENKIEEERLKAELEKTRIESEKQLRELRGDDDDDDEVPQVTMQDDSEVETLKDSIRKMEERFAEQERRHEREMQEERHRRELSELKDSLTGQINDLKSAIANNGNGKSDAVVQAQMKSMEAMISAMNQQTQVMLSSQADMTKVLLTQASRSDTGERADRLMEKLLDAKSQTGAEVMNAMKEAYNTGLQMARGAEQAPTTLADALKELSSKALETVDNFIAARGQVANDSIKSEINAAVGRAVNHIGRQIAPLLGQRSPTPPGGIPAGSAAASLPAPRSNPAHPVQPVQPHPRGSITREELREIVDDVMRQFLKDAPNQETNWITMARERIPANVLVEIGDWNFDNIMAFAYKYGSEEVVTEVMVALAEMGAQTEEQREQVRIAAQQMRERAAANAVGAPVTEPGTDASAPSQSEDDLLAGSDEDEDDETLDLADEDHDVGEPEGESPPHPDAEPVGAAAETDAPSARARIVPRRGRRSRTTKKK